MRYRKNLMVGILAALLALAGVACNDDATTEEPTPEEPGVEETPVEDTEPEVETS